MWIRIRKFLLVNLIFLQEDTVIVSWVLALFLAPNFYLLFLYHLFKCLTLILTYLRSQRKLIKFSYSFTSTVNEQKIIAQYLTDNQNLMLN